MNLTDSRDLEPRPIRDKCAGCRPMVNTRSIKISTDAVLAVRAGLAAINLRVDHFQRSGVRMDSAAAAPGAKPPIQLPAHVFLFVASIEALSLQPVGLRRCFLLALGRRLGGQPPWHCDPAPTDPGSCVLLRVVDSWRAMLRAIFAAVHRPGRTQVDQAPPAATRTS